MFTFENKNDYLAQRKTLLDKVKGLLEEGKTDEANTEMEDVSAMDEAYEKFAKAQANLNALNGVKPQTNVVPEGVIDSMNSKEKNVDLYDSHEYRKAFMDHILNGNAIPEKFTNANENTTTTDVGVMIPTTVLNRIIEKLETVGTIYNLVTHTAYKGGLAIPVSNVKPVASWVAEGKGSDRQEKRITGTITFAYHKLRCAISVSLETDTMAMSAFETAFVNSVSEAMIKAIEEAIINGDGNGKPKGILTEEVPEGQNIDIAADEGITYANLVDMEAALPVEYENGAVWCMNKKSFMEFAKMTDLNGQPIARTNYGIAGKPERSLLGRGVVLVSNMPSYAETVGADTVFAFIYRFEDYILNSNLNITIKQYEDNETDDKITKAVALVDGKAVDLNSLVTMTKKA